MMKRIGTRKPTASTGTIVQYIYEAYLANTPLYIIKKNAKKLGFSRTGNTAIEAILTNPLYYGYRYVKPWKEQAGGLFPLANHEPIIDPLTWNKVQEKNEEGPKAKNCCSR